MPTGLRTAPSTFLRTMDFALTAVKWQFALDLDNNVAFYRSAAEQVEHVKNVLILSRDSGVSLKLMKYRLFTKNIDQLGPVISSWRFKVASQTMDAIKGLKSSRNVTELKSFLGICSVFGRFSPSLLCENGVFVKRYITKWPDGQLRTERERAWSDEEAPRKVGFCAGMALIVGEGANDTR